MPTDAISTLPVPVNQIGGGGPMLPGLGGETQSPFNLQTLLGLLASGGSMIGRDEPGYVTEARQFLRNRLNPEGIPSQFTGIVSALNNQFDPYLRQQEERDIANISQRYAAAFPGSVGAQGGEFNSLARYMREQAVPTRNKFIGDLALSSLNLQGRAAEDILAERSLATWQDQLGELGGRMLVGGLSGGGTGGSLTGNSTLDSILNGITGGGNQPPAGSVLDAVIRNIGPISAAIPGGINALTSLFTTPGATQAMATMQIAENPTALAQLTQALGGAPGGPLSGTSSIAGPISMSGILGAIAAAGGGYFSGRAIGGQLPSSRAGGTAAGAAGGAAAGAIIGSIVPGIGTAIGAAIGALAGGAGGFGGSRGEDHQIKATRLAADMKSHATTASNIGAFWTAALGEAGYENLDGWSALVNQTNAEVSQGSRTYSFGGFTVNADQPDNLASIGSKLLLQKIQAHSPQITNLDQVPGFRQGYIDYILQNTFIERGGQTVRTENIGQKGSLLTHAGLSY